VNSFVDEAKIEVKSGDGGNGAVSFRREKYVPRGGPDGGDGGNGGDVVFVVKRNLKTLSHLKLKQHYRAENGAHGGSRQKHGKSGAHVCIGVPPGSLIRDPDSGMVLRDLNLPDERWIFLKGGVGGKGNRLFATPTRRAPRFAKPGAPGQVRRVVVELNLIADIGLVGLPNAGKSTLLSRLSRARPKVGDYPFTTREPHLGVLRFRDRELTIADIPGIIEGAASGAGLGLKFLKHISRTSLLMLLIDLHAPDCLSAPTILLNELRAYSTELAQKRRMLVGNKIDLPGSEEAFQKLKEEHPEEATVGISALHRSGLESLKDAIEKAFGCIE
jgi:GTP-binding protein